MPREEPSEPPPAADPTRKRSGVRKAVGWAVEQPFAREGAPCPPSPPPEPADIELAVAIPAPRTASNPWQPAVPASHAARRALTPPPSPAIAPPPHARSTPQPSPGIAPPPHARFTPQPGPAPKLTPPAGIAVRRATPVGGTLVLNDFTKRTVSYMSPARIVSGDQNIDGRCDGIGVEGVLLLVPEGLVAHDNVVVRFSLPVSDSMVSIPCAVVWRAPGRAGQELLGCQFSVVRQEVQREIFDYVAALRSKSLPPPDS